MSQETSSNNVPATKRPSVVGAWIQTARPKTLVASSIPVITALALAWGDLHSGYVTTEAGRFLWIPAVCCLMFSILAQVAANFINDYGDFKRGADEADGSREEVAVLSGWISPRAILIGCFVVLGAACCFGLATIPYGGWTIVAVGAVSCVFCLLYSEGPKPLSYIGLGDVLVITFFGVVSVTFTYYLQTQKIALDAILVGLAVGIAVDNILVANNYRDRDDDYANHKYTLVALLGERFGRYFYLINGLIVFALVCLVLYRRDELFAPLSLTTLIVYLAFHLQAWFKLVKIAVGPSLLQLIALSARNVVVLGVLLAVTLAL